MNGNNRNKGFTLVELLFVVLIIAALVATALPAMGSYRNKSHNAAAVSDLRNLKSNLEAVAADNQSYPEL